MNLDLISDGSQEYQNFYVRRYRHKFDGRTYESDLNTPAVTVRTGVVSCGVVLDNRIFNINIITAAYLFNI